MRCAKAILLAGAAICGLTPDLSAEALPKPIFEVSFDGSAEASAAGGMAKPLKCEGVSFSDGVKGKAALFSGDAKLEYQAKGNLIQERGSATLWFKPNWEPEDGGSWHGLLSEQEPPSGHAGSGALWLWIWGNSLRGDIGDKEDSYATELASGLSKGAWSHVAFTWDIEKGQAIYLNGGRAIRLSDSESPLSLERRRDFSALKNRFRSFIVGSLSGNAADGMIDELKIYGAPLSPEQVAADMAKTRQLKFICLDAALTAGEEGVLRWKLENVSDRPFRGDCAWRVADMDGKAMAGGVEKDVSLKPSKSAIMSARMPALQKGKFKLAAACGSEPPQAASVWALGKSSSCVGGSGSFDATLLERIDFAKGFPSARFASKGAARKRKLGQTPYFEAGTKMNDRFAAHASLPESNALYLIEWDYPDDKRRTMEMIVQEAKSPGEDYGIQTGVFCGGEYPLSMKIMTHRAVYWAKGKDIAIIFMTAMENAPAAVAELRICRINDGKLPDAKIVDAAPVNGWTRTVGIHFEDPALNYDFGVEGGRMPKFEATLDRLVAYMKWSGQNFLSYPALWYQGRIGDAYQPRPHDADYLGCLLEKFSSNGLLFMPAFNLQNIEMPPGFAMTPESATDGSLNASPVMILSDGKPNPGGWHGTPPNFNPLHPAVQAAFEKQIDELLERYSSRPAFKGVAFHLATHNLGWFGSLDAGYNDYNADAFERDTGVKIPVDRKSPQRGKLFHDWLLANAREKWISWRCAKLAAWHSSLAAKLAAKRADLRLAIYSYAPSMGENGDDARSSSPDFSYEINREAGLDAKLLGGNPLIALSQTIFPADYRHAARSKEDGIEKYLAFGLDGHRRPGTYSMLEKTASPWVNMHDRYFEDGIGGSEWWGANDPLKAPWLKEIGWRVSTLNPNANSFLEHYVMPLRHGDVLGCTKGGFLIGTTGAEAKLAAFAKTFRQLPCVKFKDLQGSTETVKIRAYASKEAVWIYAVNTGAEAAKAELPLAGLTELQDMKQGPSAAEEIALEPYQLRAFKGPAGLDLRKLWLTK